MEPDWHVQIVSDIIRDGLGVELLDSAENIAAEVFRCDADHTVTVRVFGAAVPKHLVDELVDIARRRFVAFEDGSPLPETFGVEYSWRTGRWIKRSADHTKGAIALGDPGHYPDLVWRYWRGFLGGVALFVILGPLLVIFGQRHYPVANGVLAVVLGVGFLWCWGSAAAAWFAILRFRCPRCGKRCALSCLSSWPTSTCKHCGLFMG